jgi:hypothetical protein
MRASRLEQRVPKLVALLGATVITACGAWEAEYSSLEGDQRGTAVGTGAGGSAQGAAGPTGTGGTDKDASIVVEPDGEVPTTVNPYADLCGKGECKISGSGEDCMSDAMGQSCQLVASDGSAKAQCDQAGASGVGFACQSAKDCAPGHGCTASPNGGGVCRAYCCGDAEACPMNTYCEAQPMAEAAGSDPPIMIPVCFPTLSCKLLDQEMPCPDGLMCTIVKADGTTSCIPPGEGQLGDACPCAPGYVCSKLTDECKKLCHIGKDEIDCGGTATCQAGIAGYQDGIGTCVGDANP